MENVLGQQFGNYRLIEYIGSGANGDVYKGQDVHAANKQPVAVKVLKAPLKDPDDATRFIDEVRVIFSLKHPNIIELLDFGIKKKNYHPFLVMNYAVGSLPKRRQLAPSLIVNYVKQIAAALQHAHNNRVIHRDIKPDNILLGPKDEVWVSDFGIAITAHRTETWVPQKAIGTLSYMAPEQLQAKAETASDQYSLGIIVYEWLTGTQPFSGDEAQLIYQHNFVPPPPLSTKIPTISPQAEQVVPKALAKDPQQRFASIQEFSDALEQALLPPRKIALFGYETDGGRDSVLWNNPQTFFSDVQYTASYAAWSKTKRDFTEKEILSNIWVKASMRGPYSFQVRFFQDGSLSESALFASGTPVNGSWKLLDGVLRMNVKDYELDIFANRDSSLHSGIEFKKGQSTPWSYFTVFQTKALNAKQWDMLDVPDLIHRIYGQVLHRRADESGLITYGAMLHRGEKSVREIVKTLAYSQEYREKFIDPLIKANMVDAAVELCYEHLLGRNADDSGRSEYIKVMQTQGSDVVIKALIDSDEYKKSFGEDDLPPTTAGCGVSPS